MLNEQKTSDAGDSGVNLSYLYIITIEKYDYFFSDSYFEALIISTPLVRSYLLIIISVVFNVVCRIMVSHARIGQEGEVAIK